MFDVDGAAAQKGAKDLWNFESLFKASRASKSLSGASKSLSDSSMSQNRAMPPRSV